MKKVVTWGPPKIASSVKKPGTYGTFKEMFQKAQERSNEQEQAHEFLQKASPLMMALLEVKLRDKDPLVVMRPLNYRTSELVKSDDPRSNDIGKFRDVVATIMPGTKLVLKGLDPTLQEFLFEDGRGKEHAISYSEKNLLMTQTDIFETVRTFLNNKGE